MPTTPRPLLAAVLAALGPVLSGCLAAPSIWQPSAEDLGVDTGPDPGTCEALHDCGPARSTVPK